MDLIVAGRNLVTVRHGEWRFFGIETPNRYRRYLPLCHRAGGDIAIILWPMQLRSIAKNLKHSNVSLCSRAEHVNRGSPRFHARVGVLT